MFAKIDQDRRHCIVGCRDVTPWCALRVQCKAQGWVWRQGVFRRPTEVCWRHQFESRTAEGDRPRRRRFPFEPSSHPDTRVALSTKHNARHDCMFTQKYLSWKSAPIPNGTKASGLMTLLSSSRKRSGRNCLGCVQCFSLMWMEKELKMRRVLRGMCWPDNVVSRLLLWSANTAAVDRQHNISKIHCRSMVRGCVFVSFTSVAHSKDLINRRFHVRHLFSILVTGCFLQTDRLPIMTSQNTSFHSTNVLCKSCFRERTQLTSLISWRHFFWTSGCLMRNRIAHNRVVLDVSPPAMNRSKITCKFKKSVDIQFLYFSVNDAAVNQSRPCCWVQNRRTVNWIADSSLKRTYNSLTLTGRYT